MSAKRVVLRTTDHQTAMALIEVFMVMRASVS